MLPITHKMSRHWRATVAVFIGVVGSCVLAGQVGRVGADEIFTGGTKDGRDPAAVADSDRLAYVVGRYQGLYEEDADQSVWIWSAADKRSRKIRDGAHHVSWARFDGNLYLLELVNGGARQVLRVNAATGSIEKTNPSEHLLLARW